jgi:hypothetical protein
MGELGQNLSLARDAVGHDAIESGNPVRGDQEQFLAEIENLPDLAAFELFDSR